MKKITFLPGLTKEQVLERRRAQFLALSPEEKLVRYFSLIEISMMTGNNQSRKNAKTTLKRQIGYSK